MDYIDAIRRMNNIGKGIPSTAANKSANLMRDVASKASVGGSNIINTNLTPKINIARNILPYADSLYNIGSGGYKAFHGHPILGTGQALFGLGEGALDTLALLLGPETGGTSAFASSAIKQGAKSGAKAIAKNLLKSNAIKSFRSGKTRAIGTVAPEVLSWLVGNDNNASNNTEQVKQNNTKTKSGNGGSMNTNLYRYGVSGINNNSKSNISQSNTQDANQSQQLSDGNIYDILNNWKEQQEYMRPYREGLAKYIQNYPELYRNAYARDMYLSGLGDLEGSSHMASIAGKYNPMTEQAKLLDLQKAIGGELQGVDNDYQSLVGNLITAQRMGLNPNQVFANDKLLQLMNSNEIANAKLAQALQLAQARMALQQQLANQRISASYRNTALRNNASMDRAIFNNIFTKNPKAGLNWIRSKGYNISDDILDSLADNLFDEE